VRSFIAWLPEVMLITTGLALILFDLAAPKQRSWVRGFSVGALALIVVASVLLAANRASYYGPYFSGMLVLDRFTTYSRLLFGVSGILVLLASWDFYGDEMRLEYFALLIFSLVGEIVIVSAQSMLVLFVGIELLALPTYALTAILKKQVPAVEAGLKYFLLGMFASIVMLYGIALLYGSLGTVSYTTPLFAHVPAASRGLALFAFFFLFMGLGFKIVSFPFHFWSPDVYAGGSTPVIAYISTVPKVAIILALFRILGPTFTTDFPTARIFLGALAVLSMTYGNLVALMQTDVRRMLAYSGISNTGYAMVALVAGGADSYVALMFFLVVYTFANIGAFFVVLGLSGQNPASMSDFDGLAKRSPYLALAMAIFLFSLAGTPPMAGFFGKFALFKSAVEHGFAYLALVGLLNSVISVGYYLRVTQRMYSYEPTTGDTSPKLSATIAVPGALRSALGVAVAATLLLGVVGIPFLGRFL